VRSGSRPVAAWALTEPASGAAGPANSTVLGDVVLDTSAITTDPATGLGAFEQGPPGAFELLRGARVEAAHLLPRAAHGVEGVGADPPADQRFPTDHSATTPTLMLGEPEILLLWPSRSRASACETLAGASSRHCRRSPRPGPRVELEQLAVSGGLGGHGQDIRRDAAPQGVTSRPCGVEAGWSSRL